MSSAEHLPARFGEILFATDFSAVSAMALPYAAAIARHFASSLCVVHVIPPEDWKHLSEPDRGPALARMRLEAEARVAQIVSDPRFRGVSANYVLQHGEILPVLAAVAEQRRADLIVLGMHGRHGIEKMLLGSLAEEILRLAHLPILVVGPQVSIAPEAELKVQRILYAADFSPGCGRAMHYAGALARTWQAHLLLLHVVGDIWKEPASTRLPSQEFLRMRLLEEGWMRDLEPMQPELLVEFGPVEQRILEVAERHRVELIVLDVPTTGHPGLVSHLPGPLAYNIASHARCPVLAVRAIAESGPGAS